MRTYTQTLVPFPNKSCTRHYAEHMLDTYVKKKYLNHLLRIKSMNYSTFGSVSGNNAHQQLVSCVVAERARMMDAKANGGEILRCI